MKQTAIFLLGCTLILGSCTPRITTSISKNYAPLDDAEEVKVIELNESVPANSEVLGVVKIGDTGFSVNCGWDVVINKAKTEARKAGGNAIKIVEHIPPSIFGSSCDRITANILNIANYGEDQTVTIADNTEIDNENVPNISGEVALRNKNFPHFRAALNGGWSYRTAKLSDDIPSDFEQYSKELKSGFHYGVDLSYYFSRQAGIGFKYSVYKTANSIDNIYLTTPDGMTLYGKMSDDISIDFIGPFFSMRSLKNKNNNSLILNFGFGYMGYNNDIVLISDYKMNGSTLGFCWDIGYDIGISENMAVGFQLSLLSGVLTQVELSDGSSTETIKLEEGNYESLARIDLSLGLKFKL